MKKCFYLLLSLLAIALIGRAQGSVTINTAKSVGENLSLATYCTSIDEPLIIDWGDGVEKSYTIDPDGYWYQQEVTEQIKGQTIKIKGNIKYFYCSGQQLTSFVADGLSSIKELDLSDNEIADLQFCEMPQLESMNISKNKLKALTLTGMPNLSKLRLNNNEIDSYQLDITSLSESLTDLNLSYNKLAMLNLMNFSKLRYFDASYNPDLTTVVFNDGSTELLSIEMSNCYIMHFYAISLPNLATLSLSNNALMEFELGEYPNLSSLALSGNYMKELDIAKYTKLVDFRCAGNQLTSLNLSNNTELESLVCNDNQLSSLDVRVNKNMRYLNCANNQLKEVDISTLANIQNLNVSGNPIRYLDLTNAYYLETLEAAETQCDHFYMNYINPGGSLAKVDVRNNVRLTSDALSMMFKTMPAHAETWSSEPTLLIEGSNGEHSNTAYVTSSDMKWVVDVTGDGTAQNAETDITLTDASRTEETIHVEGQTGGSLMNDGIYDFTKYTTENGAFAISQWQTPYYQKMAEVTDKANIGVPICIFVEPDDGYKFKSVTVNDEEIGERCFVVNGPSTIKVNFIQDEPSISFTTDVGRELQFSLAGDNPNTPIYIDWGNGSRQELQIGDSPMSFINGTAAGGTITIYGEVTRANFESYELPGTDLVDNEITSIDLSNNKNLTELIVYGNPISSLDVSNQKGLTILDCGACYELAELNIAENPALTEIDCHANKISSLDLSNCHGLIKLDARNNQLAEISFDNNPELVSVNLTNNKLQMIDLTKLGKLSLLEISGNMLKEIDLKQNPELMELAVANNQLTALDLASNTKLQSLSFNGNAVVAADLSMLTELSLINCGGNGMSACDLNDFYYNLPVYPNDPDAGAGTTLTVANGEEDTPNDARNADSMIATEKGWIVNVEGNGSGCDDAYLTIEPSDNGYIEITDLDGNIIESGQKVKKNVTLKATAFPDNGYEFDAIVLNGNRIENLDFALTRASKISALFKLLSGIHNTELEGVSVGTENGCVVVASETHSLTEIFNLQGVRLFVDNVNGVKLIPMSSGIYVVRITNSHGDMVKTISVK